MRKPILVRKPFQGVFMSFMTSFVRLCGNIFLLSFLFSFSLCTVYGGGKGKGAVGEDGERPTAYILTVAGGGLRGVIPAKILTLMEERLQYKLNKGQAESEHTQVRLADFFDVMAGTSTGGIIVSALNTPVASNDNQPRTSKDILRFYTDHAEEIFPAQGVVA